ncbi:MAG: hypothetical protein FWC41_12585 [Firmicutes bacterium]|nr:hypothetical protein [Bacillota bacterium]
MIRAIIIEDSQACVEHLRRAIRNFPKIKILGKPAENIDAAVKLINIEKPNLVFLDLGLRDGGTRDGLIALNKAKYKNFHVIIFTGGSIEECYKEAFRYEKTAFCNTISVQYIWKNSDFESELKEAIKYCCSNLSSSEDKIVIPISKRRLLIENICNIDMCKVSLKNIPIPIVKKEYGTMFYLVNKEAVCSIKSIDSFKNELTTFFDIGNDCFLNKSNVKEISVDERYVIMESGNKFEEGFSPEKIKKLYDEFRKQIQ